MADPSPRRIVDVALGFMAAKHLFVANEIGLFETLAAGPLTLEALTERLAVPPRTARIVADAMVALGFLAKTDGRYRNTQEAAASLAGDAETGLRPFLRLMNRLRYPAWEGLEEAVRSGGSGVLSDEVTAEEQRLYSAGVEALTTEAAQALASVYDFGSHRAVMDLGGGTGSFLIQILRRHPHLAATLFDLPATIPVARARLAREDVGARINLVAGDIFEDKLPHGHDAVIVANVVHCFAPDRNLDLLRRVRRSVETGARLLLVDLWTDATRVNPAGAALFAGEFLVTCGEGDVYSEDDARGWLEATGWRMTRRETLAAPFSLVIAEAAPVQESD